MVLILGDSYTSSDIKGKNRVLFPSSLVKARYTCVVFKVKIKLSIFFLDQRWLLSLATYLFNILKIKQFTFSINKDMLNAFIVFIIISSAIRSEKNLMFWTNQSYVSVTKMCRDLRTVFISLVVFKLPAYLTVLTKADFSGFPNPRTVKRISQ